MLILILCHTSNKTVNAPRCRSRGEWGRSAAAVAEALGAANAAEHPLSLTGRPEARPRRGAVPKPLAKPPLLEPPSQCSTAESQNNFV